MGTVYHAALEMLARGATLEMACEDVYAAYQNSPDNTDNLEWTYERETVLRLVCAYQWRWSEAGLVYFAPEEEFRLPLINPQTGHSTPIFQLAGKIDGIVQLADGRLAVIEHKLLGDDIGQDSELWRRMRIDHQVSLYVLAARRIGFEVDTVLYDVARKPAIQPTTVPFLDQDGLKIVLDCDGTRVLTKQGKPRQAGDSELGFVLQSRPMTTDEWGEKLANDITARPDFYFQRIEIPRMDADLAEYESELWEIQQSLRDAQRTDRWFRTVNRNTCGFCGVFDLCTNRGLDPHGPLPEGFIRLDNPHPELKENHNGDSPSTSAAEAAPAV